MVCSPLPDGFEGEAQETRPKVRAARALRMYVDFMVLDVLGFVR
jgi:hypothetical protein